MHNIEPEQAEPSHPVMRSILRISIRFLFWLFARVEIAGLENVPYQGGAILAVNHISRLDAPLVYVMIDREDATGLVADKYKKSIFFRWIVTIMDGIWINREEADFKALKEARDYLKSGKILGIAPEGTRSPNGKMQSAKTGTAYLADKAGVPVIPVAITGTEKAFRELSRLKRPRLSVHYGEPLRLLPIERQNRDKTLQQNTDEIMCHIAAELPEEYRGVYADHPRLKELLSVGEEKNTTL